MYQLIILVLIIILLSIFSCKSYFKNIDEKIPKVIIQTYHKKIPKKVYDQFKKYAKDYKHIIYKDKQCINFIKNNYPKSVIKYYFSLKNGAHRADLFRYCYLYINGGIYMDIKTELTTDISNLFNDNYLTTCLTEKRIFNGIIATRKKNPILLDLIHELINTPKIIGYHDIIWQFSDILKKYTKEDLKYGLNNNNIYLFKEEVSDTCSIKDRYNLCSVIKDNDKIRFNTRFKDFGKTW